MRESISVMRRLSAAAGLAALVAVSSALPGLASDAADADSTAAPAPAVAFADSATAGEEALLQLVTDAEEAVAAGSSTTRTDGLIAALARLREALEARTLSLAEPGEAGDEGDLGGASVELGDAVEQAFDEAGGAEPVEDAGLPLAGGPRMTALTRVNDLAAEVVKLVETLRDLRSAFGSRGRSGADDAVGGDEDASTGEDEGADETREEGATRHRSEGAEAADAEPEEESFGEVSGLVTENGEPVAGAEIVDEDTGERATTDAHGVYRLRALASVPALRLAIHPRGRAVARERIALGEGRERVADLELRRGGFPGRSGALVRVLGSRAVARGAIGSGGTLSGVVLGADGRPAARRLIRLDDRTWARTDASGRYRFYRVGPGLHTITAMPGAGAPASVRVRATANAAAIPAIRLSRVPRMDAAASRARRPAGTLRLDGRIVDAAGAGVPRARVLLLTEAGRPALSTRTRTGGGFRLSGLDAGRHRLLVQRQGFVTTSREVLVGGGEARDLRIVLRSTARPIAQRRPAPPAVRARHAAVASGRDGDAPPPPARAARRSERAAERVPDAPPPPAVSGPRARRAEPASERAAVGDLVVVVQDSRGRRMEGAVSVEHGRSVVAREATTGGTCVIRGVPAGPCRVAVRAIGGRLASRSVRAHASRTTHVRLVVAR